MALRFRKSIKIAPGFRFNISPGGVSTTAGRRGTSVNFGKRGAYANLGSPIPGIGFRQKLSGPTESARSGVQATGQQKLTVTFRLKDDGNVDIADSGGGPLPPALMKKVREQNAETISVWLKERSDEFNGGIDSILNLHLGTPAPDESVTYAAEPYPAPMPERPPHTKFGLSRVFKGTEETYKTQLAEWESNRAKYDAEQARLKVVFGAGRTNDVAAMDECLAITLNAINWPRDTQVSYQIDNGGKTLLIDVDLPEIEDMPKKQAAVAARGIKLNVTDRSESQIRREYATHIHAIAFLVVGCAFASLPTLENVVISGYSQRPDPSTGHTHDEYLYSIRVAREAWSRLNFVNLESINVIDSLGGFEIRRSMSKSFAFSVVDPFTST